MPVASTTAEMLMRSYLENEGCTQPRQIPLSRVGGWHFTEAIFPPSSGQVSTEHKGKDPTTSGPGPMEWGREERPFRWVSGGCRKQIRTK